MANTTVLTANVSPLIPFQFPTFYREDYPNFVAFVQAYYQWLEQSNNASYFARRIYDIEDVDNTFDQFIVYFKEKYLKNIQFTTATNIRTVIKHALDIYRSKGTEQCITLLFQLAFDEIPAFYYPSTDLFKLSDGVWTIPTYLELTLQWDNNIQLQEKEIVGSKSGATAFVDNIIRRKTNNRMQDVAYISAINGNFETGEQIQPTDGSLPISKCPFVIGSLSEIIIQQQQQGYELGANIPISSTYGNGGIIRVSNTVDESGFFQAEFIDGGWGYAVGANTNIYISNASLQISNLVTTSSNLEFVHYFYWMDTVTEPMASINYINSNNVWTIGANVFTYYANNLQSGYGIILNSTAANSTAGTLLISVYSGTFNSTNIYGDANSVHANVAASNGYTNSTATASFIANADLIILQLSANTPAGFIVGEEIFSSGPLSGPVQDEKIEGWGIIQSLGANSITVNNVTGIFRVPNPVVGIQVTGIMSNTTANAVSTSINMGVINTAGTFFASPYALVTTPLTTGIISEVFMNGSGFSVTVANTLSYTENVSINTDLMGTYSAVSMAANTYGFPANPTANANTGTMASCLTMESLTIGKINNAITSEGIGFTAPPYIVIDCPIVSNLEINDVLIEISNASASFVVGEIVTQQTTNALGMVRASSNSSFLYLERMSYANNFIVTANSTTTISGSISSAVANVINVDYDYMSQYMGRNASFVPEILSGNNIITNAQIIVSGYGFVNGEVVTIGSNGATGIAVIQSQGYGPGYYATDGGFLSDTKKLFDGYFYQNFSYQIISPIMLQKYQQMLTDITHVSGTIMFGNYVHNSYSNDSLNIANSVLTISIPQPANNEAMYYYYLGF